MNKQIYDDKNQNSIYFWGSTVLSIKRSRKKLSRIRKIFYILIEAWILLV